MSDEPSPYYNITRAYEAYDSTKGEKQGRMKN